MMNTAYHLCFRPLLDAGRAYIFPCDAVGRVDLDRLSDRVRNEYLFARTLVGRVFQAPDVQPDDAH